MKEGLLLIGMILMFSACVEEATPGDALVLQRLGEKKKDYLNDMLDRCRQDAIQRAEMYVDSLLSEQIQISVNDTVQFPLKPERPDLVPLPAPDKFIKPEPIFLDTVLGRK